MTFVCSRGEAGFLGISLCVNVSRAGIQPGVNLVPTNNTKGLQWEGHTLGHRVQVSAPL